MIFTSLISALLFYLIPFLLGRAVVRIIHKRHQLFIPAVSYFVVGSIMIFLIGLISRYILIPFFMPGVSFIELFKVLLLVILGGSLIVNILLLWRATDLKIINYIWPFILSGFLALIAFSVWGNHSPYPLNWDFLEHQTLVNNILAGRFSYFTSQITDSFIFNGYSPFFHLNLAVSQMLIPFDIVSFWQSISFIHLFLVILASYLLALVITDNKKIAVISAIINAFVFETVAFTSLFFIPQTLTAVIFIFLFIQLLMEIKHDRILPLWLVIISCFYLILCHYVIGFVALAIYLGMYLFIRYGVWLKSKVNVTAVIELGIMGAILLILFSSLISLGFLNQGEGQYFNFTLTQKTDFFREAYGYSLFIFLPLGVLYVIRRKKLAEIIMLVLASVLFVIVLIQVSYVLKFYVLGGFFVNFILAMGIYLLINKISGRIAGISAYGFLLLVFMSIFIVNAGFWKANLYYQNILSGIAPEEISAAKFLKEKYQNSDVLLISDPATQHILETFSDINTQGGAYTNKNTRDSLISLNDAKDTAEVKDKLFLINDAVKPVKGNKLFVLSGRYFNWQLENKDKREALYFNIWVPSDLSFDNQKYIQYLLSDPQHFNLVYQNNTLAILEVFP